MKRRTPQLPLDSLSSIVMIANAQPDDLIDVFGPFGKKFMAIKKQGDSYTTRILQPGFADRLLCRDHLLVTLHRNTNLVRDTSLDWMQTVLAQDTLERLVRLSIVKVFGVRRPSTKTWDQCPHCRWKERDLERFRQ